jgi:hypothetical protein
MSNEYTFVIHPDPIEAAIATDDFINHTEEYKFLENELDKLGLISHELALSISYTLSEMIMITFEKAPNIYFEFMEKYGLRKEK